MKASFYEPPELETEVKRLIRKHNLYHLVEPYLVFKTVYFYIEGSVENYNAFSQEYQSIRDVYEVSLKAKRRHWPYNPWFWVKLLGAYTYDLWVNMAEYLIERKAK